MRRNILKEVIKEKLLINKYNKKFIKNPRFLDCYLQNNQGIVFSGYCNNTKEFVRLIVNAEQNKYLLKTCKSYIGNIDYHILPDFDELDERLLHLQTIHKEIDVLNIDKDSPYYDFIEWAKLIIPREKHHQIQI